MRNQTKQNKTVIAIGKLINNLYTICENQAEANQPFNEINNDSDNEQNHSVESFYDAEEEWTEEDQLQF